ncbi:MAG: hypothetical protein GY850_15490 [bacterium]|nr:hypothetical protein [bacterium]
MKKTQIFAPIIFFLIILTFSHSFAAYDRFEHDLIDAAKWTAGEKVRQVSDNKLRLVTGGSGPDALVGVSPIEPVTSYFGAKVTVESGSRHFDGSSGRARLAGFYYNDSRGPDSGQEYNGYEGNVWAQVVLHIDDTGNLSSVAKVIRAEDSNHNTWSTLFKQIFATEINFDTEYLLSIEFVNSQFIFKCNNETLTYPVTTPMYDAYNRGHNLVSKAKYGTGGTGCFKARFDDVYVNNKTIPYDTFSDDSIDLARWGAVEEVREIANGKLRLGIKGFNQQTSNYLYPAAEVTTYLGAKVLIKSSSYVSDNAVGVARLAGYFFNESRGPGSGEVYNGYEGNIWAQVLLYFEGNGKIAALAKVVRTEDENDTVWTTLFSQEFATVINFDAEYRLSMEFSVSKFIFKCNSEALSYQVITPTYEAFNPYHSLTARLVLDSGEDGYIMTSFDDVFINSKSFTLLPSILSILIDGGGP